MELNLQMGVLRLEDFHLCKKRLANVIHQTHHTVQEYVRISDEIERESK
jgi:hypothetical protein